MLLAIDGRLVAGEEFRQRIAMLVLERFDLLVDGAHLPADVLGLLGQKWGGLPGGLLA